MKIKQLAPDVVKRLRSGVAITSVSQCVEELVWNSIDAGATCIAVRLNLPFFKIQVVDNGCGILPEQMELVGIRYATSKCHSLHDLENLRFSGYRGEALASLKDISSILMIESRTANNANTYCKIFTQGKAPRPKKSIKDRPSKGTTISVFDFMYNLPVRKKSISESLDINECRRTLQSIALMHPHLSFSLESEATGDMCFQFKKSQSLPLAFAQLFGKVRAGCLKSFHHRVDDYEIDGYISTDHSATKDLQFLYVNKRCVLKTRLQKLINSILGQALSCKQRLKVDPLKSTPESPVKSQMQFFIYVINIVCPYSKCDVIFEPRKTVIEFSEWDKFQNGKRKTSLSGNTENSDTISFASQVPDIPNRSVFPVDSPVMLRIPVQSTLSNLEKGQSGALLRLREKYNRKYLGKTLHQEDDEGNSSDTSVIKRLKSSSTSNSSSPEYHFVEEEVNLKSSVENVSNQVHNSKDENNSDCTVESDKHVLSSLSSSDPNRENYALDDGDTNIFLQPFVNTFHGFVDEKAASSNFVENIKDGLKTDKIEGSEDENLEDIPPASTGEFTVSNSACVSELVKIAAEMPFSSFSASINESSLEQNTPLHDTNQIALSVADNNPEQNVNSSIALCENNAFFTNSSSSNENDTSACLTKDDFCKDKNSDSPFCVMLSHENESEPSNTDVGNVLENTVQHNGTLIAEGIEEHSTALPVENISDEKANTNVTSHQTSSPTACLHEMKKIPSRWILRKDPINGRVVYIDSVTGNSSYETPECVPEDPEINNELEKENRIEEMLVKWQNPMFEVPSEVNCVEDIKYSENLPQMYCILNSYRFSKSALENLKVVGQVDCKFIACIVSNINENNTNQNLLVLFDQHAVHERVRLEELTEELYEINENNEKIVKTSSLTSPLKLVLETEEIRLLRTYYMNLQKLGIHISFSDETGVIFVNSIPSCLVDKATNKLKRKLAEIEGIMENTIKEWLIMLARTRAVSYVLPKSICAILNSQACRGAVKFGDPLSLSECQELLVLLADCKLPFQCAHGRPSIAPILDLNKIAALSKKRSTPQLSNIKKLMLNMKVG
ncbi:DNA mismatch repair protein Mlh3-like [Uloborus diversus]|uniref:DNA mismatch repair protein Mlh3-like n=1 Tax=Uloborus diversus TaxID=327109 RepID=UPI0024092C6A|nr:DNA mismatch repair protein Mlh3-like [Uloborus diversus]